MHASLTYSWKILMKYKIGNSLKKSKAALDQIKLNSKTICSLHPQVLTVLKTSGMRKSSIIHHLVSFITLGDIIQVYTYTDLQFPVQQFGKILMRILEKPLFFKILQFCLKYTLQLWVLKIKTTILRVISCKIKANERFFWYFSRLMIVIFLRLYLSYFWSCLTKSNNKYNVYSL